MVKKCIILHINDGSPEELQNGDRMYVERFTRMEGMLNEYLKEGYEVKHMVEDFTPSIQEEGVYSFYKSGMVFYLEKGE